MINNNIYYVILNVLIFSNPALKPNFSLTALFYTVRYKTKWLAINRCYFSYSIAKDAHKALIVLAGVYSFLCTL